jgi:hypothetical protein
MFMLTSTLSAQTYYQRYIVGTDNPLWSEQRAACSESCPLEVLQAASTDPETFPYFVGSTDGQRFSFWVDFWPKHPGKFVNTTTVQWTCGPAKGSCGGGYLSRTFYLEAIVDTGFYFPNNYFNLSLQDDAFGRRLFDTLSLEYYNKSTTDVELIGLRPVVSDPQNYNLRIMYVDSDVVLKIDSSRKHGYIHALFETRNGPDTIQRSCLVSVEYRVGGVTRFDTLFVRYHEDVKPQVLSITPSEINFYNYPGQFASSTAELAWTSLIDSVWISDSVDVPFRFLGSSSSLFHRQDTYAFEAIDNRLTASSSVKYSYREHLYNNQAIVREMLAPRLTWALSLDSVQTQGHILGSFHRLLDTVTTWEPTHITIGTISVTSECARVPAFSLAKHDSKSFALTQIDDSTWSVDIKPQSAAAVFTDVAKIYLALQGPGCPPIDFTTIPYSVVVRDRASVQSEDLSASPSITQFATGAIRIISPTHATLQIYSVAGLPVRAVTLNAGEEMILSSESLASGLYFYTIRAAGRRVVGKILLP